MNKIISRYICIKCKSIITFFGDYQPLKCGCGAEAYKLIFKIIKEGDTNERGTNRT